MTALACGLGHAAALTAHWAVIHHRVAACGSPKGGACDIPFVAGNANRREARPHPSAASREIGVCHLPQRGRRETASPEMQICAERDGRSMIGATPVFYSGQWTTDGEGMRLRRMFIEWDYHTSSETEPMFPEGNISIGARQIGVLRGGGWSKEKASGAQRGGSQGGEIFFSPPSCASLELSSHKGRKRSS